LVIGHNIHNTLALLLIGGGFQGAWMKKENNQYCLLSESDFESS